MDVFAAGTSQSGNRRTISPERGLKGEQSPQRGRHARWHDGPICRADLRPPTPNASTARSWSPTSFPRGSRRQLKMSTARPTLTNKKRPKRSPIQDLYLSFFVMVSLLLLLSSTKLARTLRGETDLGAGGGASRSDGADHGGRFGPSPFRGRRWTSWACSWIRSIE